MEKKKVLAGWSIICHGCHIGRKYPDYLQAAGSQNLNQMKEIYRKPEFELYDMGL